MAGENSRQLGWQPKAALFHYRTHAGQEVDLVLESVDGRVVGVEVKASANVTATDLTGLRALRADAGERFFRGVVLYAGARSVRFEPDLYAMPMSALCTTTCSGKYLVPP